jgi:hypothetical protein
VNEIIVSADDVLFLSALIIIIFISSHTKKIKKIYNTQKLEGKPQKSLLFENSKQ